MKWKIRTYSRDVKLVKQRRKEIYMTAAKLFLKTGYQGTSMRKLAEAVGISVAGLYHYIGTKVDIVHMIIEFTIAHEDKVIEEIRNAIEGLSSSDALREAIKLYFKSVDEIQDIHNFHNHVIAALSQEYRQILYSGQERFVDIFKEIIQKGIESGEFAVDNAELLAHNILLLGQTWANRRWFLRKRYTLDQYIELQNKFILSSIKANKNSAVSRH